MVVEEHEPNKGQNQENVLNVVVEVRQWVTTEFERNAKSVVDQGCN